MLAQYLDVTASFNSSNGVKIEMSNYDYCVVQFVSPSGTINITASNDSGAVEGTTDGNVTLSTNYQTVQATRLADGTSVTAVAAAGLYRLGVVGRYVQFAGASAAATKVLVMLAKIS